MIIKRIKVCIFATAVVMLFTLAGSASHAFETEVLPAEIEPGDAFVIQVTGTEPSVNIVAELNGKSFPFSPCEEGCYRAVIGSDIEMKPGVYRVRVRAGEMIQYSHILLKPASFPEIHLTLPEEKVLLNPEDLKRAEKEAEKLRQIWEKSTDKIWQGSFILPLDNDFSTAFGVKRIMNRKNISVHRGMDIKGRDGEKVKASNRGSVVLAEDLFFGGNTIVLDHGLGIYTVYMHLSGFNVKPGAYVSKGDIIGFVGSSGRSSGPHLHFGVKIFDLNINPASFVRLRLQ